MCPAPSSVHREPICCECQAKFGGRLPVRRAEAVLPYWVPLSLTPKAEWIHHCTFPPAKDESSHFCASSPALGILLVGVLESCPFSGRSVHAEGQQPPRQPIPGSSGGLMPGGGPKG
ncbi:uncharacterized protein C16orf95 homolog [Megaptera novaeangliae]